MVIAPMAAVGSMWLREWCGQLRTLAEVTTAAGGVVRLDHLLPLGGYGITVRYLLCVKLLRAEAGREPVSAFFCARGGRRVRRVVRARRVRVICEALAE